MKQIILALFLIFSTLTFAADAKLVVVATDQGGHPAKALCFFSNNYMVAHPEGLLVQYTCLGGPDINSEIWLVNETPKNIGTSTMGNLFTEPLVYGKTIYFFEYSEFETIALWKYDNEILTSQKIPAHLRDSHVHELSLVGDTLYFRYTNHKSAAHGEGIYNNEFVILPSRTPEFYWKPASNGELMLQKVKIGNGEAIELRTKQNLNPVVILKNQKADSSSPFKVLRNQFALRGSKWVSFANSESGLTLIRGDKESFSTEDLSKLFKDIQYWPPALSSDGEIIFRGTDLNNQFALWGYKDGLKRLIVSAGMEVTEGSETIETSSKSLLYNPPLIDENGHLFIGVGLRMVGESQDFGQGIISL